MISYIGEQYRLRGKRNRAILSELYCCAQFNPTLQTLTRRWNAARRIEAAARALRVSVGKQLIKARKGRK